MARLDTFWTRLFVGGAVFYFVLAWIFLLVTMRAANSDHLPQVTVDGLNVAAILVGFWLSYIWARQVKVGKVDSSLTGSKPDKRHDKAV